MMKKASFVSNRNGTLLIIAALFKLSLGGSLNPLSIGLRSAIARGNILMGHSKCTKSPSQTPSFHPLQESLAKEEYQCDAPIVATSLNRGGAASKGKPTERRLEFWQAMICGAISRSAAQTIMHPANTMKTILQSSRLTPGKAPLTVRSFTQWKLAKTLTRGAGAQLVLSMPHGAVNFAVLEFVRRQMNNAVSKSRYADVINRSFGPGMDFLSSALSTICCSVVSTPQMMICDNIMAGTYPNLVVAASSLMKDRGLMGFYTGWWPGLAGKIPSYGLTWTLFEQLKVLRNKVFIHPAKDMENTIMGCLASATSVCVMIPMDTIKTRLVTQLNYPDLVPYKGISDCFTRVLKEEGITAFYRGLTPRLLSVVPMIGIQFGVYEFTKKIMLSKGKPIEPTRGRISKAELQRIVEEEENERKSVLEETVMEVAADDDQPFPAPFRKQNWWGKAVEQLKKEKQPCGVSTTMK